LHLIFSAIVNVIPAPKHEKRLEGEEGHEWAAMGADMTGMLARDW